MGGDWRQEGIYVKSKLQKTASFIVVAVSGYISRPGSMSSFSLMTFIGSLFFHYDCSMYLGFGS